MDLAVEGGNFVGKWIERGLVDQEVGGGRLPINIDRETVREERYREIQEIDFPTTDIKSKLKRRVK